MYHFLTYGSGEPYYSRAKELAQSALHAGFNSATVATKDDLDASFCAQNQETLQEARGAGLWLHGTSDA